MIYRIHIFFPRSKALWEIWLSVINLRIRGVCATTLALISYLYFHWHCRLKLMSWAVLCLEWMHKCDTEIDLLFKLCSRVSKKCIYLYLPSNTNRFRVTTTSPALIRFLFSQVLARWDEKKKNRILWLHHFQVFTQAELITKDALCCSWYTDIFT